MVTRWVLGRMVQVLTPTGTWAYMRVIEVSPLHVAVRDANGRVYITARTKG